MAPPTPEQMCPQPPATHLLSACVYYTLCKPFRALCMCPQVPLRYTQLCTEAIKKKLKAQTNVFPQFQQGRKSFRKLGTHVIDIVASRWLVGVI